MEEAFDDCHDVSFAVDVEDDDTDSDAIDSDIECQLYASIYHDVQTDDDKLYLRKYNPHEVQPFSDTVADVQESDSSLQELTSSEVQGNISLIVSDSFPSSSREIIVVDTDSEEELSKTDIITKRKIFRKQHPVRTVHTLSSDTDDEEFLTIELDKPCCSNIIGTDSGLSRVSLDAESKTLFEEPSTLTDKRESSQNRSLTAFLEKCRPSYTPTSSNPSPTSSKRKTPPTDFPIRKVSLELLNKTPGNSNRFKRIKLDNGEDPNLWQVSPADLASTSRFNRRTRYYQEFKCNHCKEFTNHETRDCPFPRPEVVCYLCGFPGHFGDNCPNAICRRCRSTGHDCRMCLADVWKQECDECGLYGHWGHMCPNHWRKFSATTIDNFEGRQMSPALDMSRNTTVYCSNCVKKGHFAFECSLKPETPHFLPSSPFLIISGKMINRIKVRSRSLGSVTPKHTRFDANGNPIAGPSSTFIPSHNNSQGFSRTPNTNGFFHPRNNSSSAINGYAPNESKKKSQTPSSFSTGKKKNGKKKGNASNNNSTLGNKGKKSTPSSATTSKKKKNPPNKSLQQKKTKKSPGSQNQPGSSKKGKNNKRQAKSESGAGTGSKFKTVQKQKPQWIFEYPPAPVIQKAKKSSNAAQTPVKIKKEVKVETV